MSQVQAAYLLTNKITAGSMITFSTTENATYPKAGLIDGKQNKPTRYTATTGQYHTIDLGAGGVAVDTIAIIKHNLTSTATVTWSGSTDNFSTTQFSQALTYAATNIYYRFASAKTCRYHRLAIDNADLGSTKPELCELYLGVAVVFSRGYAYGWEKGRVANNDVHETEFNSILVYGKSKVRTRRFPWTTLSTAQELELDTLDDSASGNLVPFVLIPDLTDSTCLFGRKIGNHGAQNVQAGSVLFNVGFEFREESAGKTVT